MKAKLQSFVSSMARKILVQRLHSLLNTDLKPFEKLLEKTLKTPQDIIALAEDLHNWRLQGLPGDREDINELEGRLATCDRTVIMLQVDSASQKILWYLTFFWMREYSLLSWFHAPTETDRRAALVELLKNVDSIGIHEIACRAFHEEYRQLAQKTAVRAHLELHEAYESLHRAGVSRKQIAQLNVCKCELVASDGRFSASEDYLLDRFPAELWKKIPKKHWSIHATRGAERLSFLQDKPVLMDFEI